MGHGQPGGLSRRERQIMQILYRRGAASVAEVRGEMERPPGYSAVRATLRILEGKGAVRHVRRGAAYVYRAATPRRKAMQGAIHDLLRTYFDDSVPRAMSALIELQAGDLTPAELSALEKLIKKRR